MEGMEKNFMNKNLKVKCPHCDILFLYYESEFRPFCSVRCKMIDLGHWFNESYTVPAKDEVKELEEENGGESENENDEQSDY